MPIPNNRTCAFKVVFSCVLDLSYVSVACKQGCFPPSLDDRKSQQRLIPEDLPKKDLGELFLKYLRMHGQDDALKALVVVDEPHRKFMPGGEMRARHKHVIVHMTSPFAHKKVQEWLAGKSVNGFVSFNLTLGVIGSACLQLRVLRPCSVW